MRRHRVLRSSLSLLALLVLLLPPLPPDRPPSTASAAASPSTLAAAPPVATGLYRATVAIANPAARDRLKTLGVVVLSETPASALVLADAGQLEDLARLRFEPQTADDLAPLVAAGLPQSPWLAVSLRPLLAQAVAVEAQRRGGAQNVADLAAPVRRSLQSLAVEQKAGLAALSSVDDDGDGLTNTEESWWCLDPTNPDSDDDGTPDGVEVQQAKDWLANRRGGPPSNGPPFNGWPMAPDDPGYSSGCIDRDQDSVPDAAERWVLGLNANRESTDRDKFDDGQELFGITRWAWGSLPRADDAGIIFAEMPSWVKAPGNHPFVAAFPIPEIDVVPSSLVVEAVTVVTTDRRIEKNEQRSYSTAETKGTSTSIANTDTWNEWQEVSTTTPIAASLTYGNLIADKALAASKGKTGANRRTTTAKRVAGPKTQINVTNISQSAAFNETINETINTGSSGGSLGSTILGGLVGRVVDRAADCVEDLFTTNQERCVSGVRNVASRVAKDYSATVKDIQDPNLDLGSKILMATACVTPISCRLMVAGIHPEDKEFLINPAEASQDNPVGGMGGSFTADPSGSTAAVQRVFQISYPAPRQLPTRTETSGTSRGGAVTETHEEYEEHTVTNGQAWGSAESWGNATAVDSVHAADLWFTYKVRNSGTEYARQITNLAFNLYLGDNPNPVCTYFVGSPACGDPNGTTLFTNFMPGEEHRYTSHRIPLSLEQMKTIDLGGPVRIVVEDFSYGIDELFYQDARNAGALVAIEDGTDDGDEAIDNYLIPTWGDNDTVQDVIARYFPYPVDADSNITAIWTPEYRSDRPGWCNEPRRVGATTLWCKHAISTADWWNIYLNNLGDGTSELRATPAHPNSTVFFRFNKDSDLDGYSDRSESRLGTDPKDPASHPRPELIGGLHNVRSGNYVTATLSLLNTGLYDAYGVEAVMIAPDETISVTNNTVGGAGRVRALRQVDVGSRIAVQSPLPGTWTQPGHARPAAGGYYRGLRDKTYTFTVYCPSPGGCTVSSGDWSLTWSDSLGGTGTPLAFGATYTGTLGSPTPLPVGTDGLMVGMLNGRVYSGEMFTVSALAPRDTFQYTVNPRPDGTHSEPIVIVSYNDPQGNHRFVIPPEAMDLPLPDDRPKPLSNLFPMPPAKQGELRFFAGRNAMLKDPGVELVTTAPFTPTLAVSTQSHASALDQLPVSPTLPANTLNLVVNNPTAATLVDAHLFLEFIDISGTVAAEIPLTRTLPAGPTVVPVTWTDLWTPAPGQDYIVLAFLTDYQGNILATGGRPLSSFQADPKPQFAIGGNALTWSFGNAPQGQMLRQPLTFGNTGFGDLLTFVSDTVSLPQWSPPVDLSNNPGLSDYPQLTIEPDGTQHVVWKDTSPSNCVVCYAMKPTGGAWSTPTAVPGASERPRIALGPDSALHVISPGLVGNRWHVYHTMKPKGGAWRQAEDVTGQFTDDALGESVTVDITGTVHLFYMWNWTSQFSHTYQRPDGNWETPEPIWNGRVGSFATQAGPDGTLHVAWSDAVSPSPGSLVSGPRVYYASKAPGGQWTSPPVLLRDAGSGTTTGRVALAVDSANTPHVVWEEASTGTDGSRRILYASGSTAGSWPPALELPDSQGGTAAAIAVDAARTVHAVWRAPGRLTYASRPDGGTWAVRSYQPFSPVYGQGAPAIATGREGAVTIVWSQDAPDRTNSDIYASSPLSRTESFGSLATRLSPGDTATYPIIVDTRGQPVGPYTRTLSIRTSDPLSPTINIAVVGTVTTATLDIAPDALVRPLDITVTVTGPIQSGAWVTYTHGLQPEPQTLQPVKVLSEDYVTTWGVGKYATASGVGTASYDMFGDGRDLDFIPLSSITDSPIDSSASGTAGTNALAATNASFSPGQRILIHQSRGTDAGQWETNNIASYTPGTPGTITTQKPWAHTYTSSGASKAQVLVLKQYRSVVINNNVTWRAKAWDGNTGGVLAFLSSGTTTISGTISTAGARGNQAGSPTTGGGFMGGAAADGVNVTASTGEGASGPSVVSVGANGTGGGGGRTNGYNRGHGASGGGGGHAVAGSSGNASSGANGSHTGGTGGAIAPDSVDLTTMVPPMVFGGGAGGGAKETGATAASGSSGGGIILLFSQAVTGTGSITANGGDGLDTSPPDVGGSGGAGGAILIRAGTLSMRSNAVTATGGRGGIGNPNGAANGAAGGDGRIRIDTCSEAGMVITSPSASTRKLSCYIAEQIGDEPFNTGRLNLPQQVDGLATYVVQYGRQMTVTSATPDVTGTLQIPAGLFNSASLDALVSGVEPGPLTLRLDIGNHGAWDWEWSGTTSGVISPNVSGPSDPTKPSLAAAFNRYWDEHGRPLSGDLDVPVRVSLSRPGQVLLTNLQLTPAGSRGGSVRLLADQYSDVRLNLTVGDSSSTQMTGTVTIAADVGDDGTINWTSPITTGLPARLTTGNLAEFINGYLRTGGQTGQVDVPIRFYVSPYVPVSLEPLDSTTSSLANVALAAAGFGVATPITTAVEGNFVPISLTLRNLGGQDTGSFTVSFFASADGRSSYVGSAFVPNVPITGPVQTGVDWNTLGFTGRVTVTAVADPFGRLAETAREDDAAKAGITLLTRPDLRIAALALSDDEPVESQTVTITVDIPNIGQTVLSAAGQTSGVTQTVTLSESYPITASRQLVQQLGAPVGASITSPVTSTVSFTWTATTTGWHRLYLKADEDGNVNEADRSNNTAWRDVYVGFRGPLALAAGAPDEQAYTTAGGYGFVDESYADVTAACGNQLFRRDPGGQVVYRFDHLQPHRFYHLDLAASECDGAGRRQTVAVNGNTISDPIDLTDGRAHSLSLRLDPALYADRTISVTVQAAGIDGAVVSRIALSDVDYRYVDAGGANESSYPPPGARRPHGWLNGVGSTAWGASPYRSARVNQITDTLQYRFDAVDPGRQYQLHLTFWQPSGTGRIQQVLVNDRYSGTTVDTGDYQVHRLTIDVPAGSYDEGSIVVGIRRTDGPAGAFVNEIALEEVTLTAQSLPLAADFVAAPTAGEPPLTVIFTNTSAGVYTSTLWSFGDGATSTEPNPTYTYVTTGTYTVTLTVSDSGGSDTLTRTSFIRVGAMLPPLPPEIVKLDAGWNLVTLPLSPTGVLTAENFLREITGGPPSLIARWTSGRWDTHVRGFPANDFPIEPGVGYFVYMPFSGTLTVAGRSFDAPPPLRLAPGWTLVGLPYNGSLYTADDLLDGLVAAGVGTNIMAKWEHGAWQSKLRGVGGGFTLDRGHGYVVRSDRYVTWTPGRGP